MDSASLITAPCILIWHTQSYPGLDNLCFGLLDERRVEAEIGMAETCHRLPLHHVEGFDELWTAVGIDEMVASVHCKGYQSCSLGRSDAIGDRQHDSVAVGDDGYGHGLRGIVTVWYLNVVGKRRTRKKASNLGYVHDVEG